MILSMTLNGQECIYSVLTVVDSVPELSDTKKVVKYIKNLSYIISDSSDEVFPTLGHVYYKGIFDCDSLISKRNNYNNISSPDNLTLDYRPRINYYKTDFPKISSIQHPTLDAYIIFNNEKEMDNVFQAIRKKYKNEYKKHYTEKLITERSKIEFLYYGDKNGPVIRINKDQSELKGLNYVYFLTITKFR